MSELRSKLIKLAYQNPEIRGALLPLLKEGGSYNETVQERVDEAMASRGIVSQELAVACVLAHLGKGNLPGYDMNGPRIPNWDCFVAYGVFVVDLGNLGTFKVTHDGKISKLQSKMAEEQTYTVPEGAKNNARKALRWREEHPDEIKGMTEVGWRRARQLATKEKVSAKTVAAMAAFNRHRENAEVAAEFKDTPWKDAGYVAWLGWGGTTGIDWAREITGAKSKTSAKKAPAGKFLVELKGGLRPSSVVVPDSKAATKAVRDYIEDNVLGGSSWAGGSVYDDQGNFVARVSYNGRVWDTNPWPASDEITF